MIVNYKKTLEIAKKFSIIKIDGCEATMIWEEGMDRKNLGKVRHYAYITRYFNRDSSYSEKACLGYISTTPKGVIWTQYQDEHLTLEELQEVIKKIEEIKSETNLISTEAFNNNLKRREL